MDWSALAAVALGGVMALGGDQLGRFSVRRDAQRTRAQSIIDQCETQTYERNRKAAGEIMLVFQANPISFGDPVTDATPKRLSAIVAVMSTETPYILNQVVRTRLVEIQDTLDLVNAPTSDLRIWGGTVPMTG